MVMHRRLRLTRRHRMSPLLILQVLRIPSSRVILDTPTPHRALRRSTFSDWIQKNQGLSPQEQQRRLQQERGYSHLSPTEQRRLQDTLTHVNQMPADQRQRTLERNENMERLPAERQQQVRASASQFSQMPPERQQAMREAIRNLRNVPPGLRQSQLNSPQYNHLNPEERGIVGNLLTVESYHPPPPPPR